MSKYTDIEILILGDGDASVQAICDEGGDHETTLFIPHSVIEDLKPLDYPDREGKCQISVAKWWCRKNDVPYDSDSGWTPNE